MSPNSEILEKAKRLLEISATWPEVKIGLKDLGLDNNLNASDYQILSNLWHKKEAGKLSDASLIEELSFWAKGGGFNNHYNGFNAIPQNILISEAKIRNWQMKNMPSGAVIINPPNKSFSIFFKGK